jgi:hypothetical protein
VHGLSLRFRADYPRSTPPDLPRPADRRAWLVIGLLALAEIAGVAGVAKSYEIAQSVQSDEAEFIWFWFGMLMIELPIIGLIAHSGLSGGARSAVLTLFGVVTFLPKLLRNPSGPDYHDEYAHWRATYDILTSGKLFQPTPILPIISGYPGLHVATASIVNFSGLNIWQSGTLLLVLCHLAEVLGIAALARSVGLDSRAAGIAAILYAANSSYLYFDTQFSYESMAIALLIWALVCFVQAIRSPRRRRAVWVASTVALCAGTVITHHLTSLGLSLFMLLISIALSIPPLARQDEWKRTAGRAWGLTLTMSAMFGIWIFWVAPGTASYLFPYVGQGLSQLMNTASGSGGHQTLFAASLSPVWEQDSAFLLVPVMLALAVVATFSARSRMKGRPRPDGTRASRLPRGSMRATFIALTVLGLVYFPSTLFILSAAGAEGARRSWAESWVGLTIFVAPAAVFLLRWAGNRRRLLSRSSARTVLALGMVLILVGGVAAGQDAVYRFPGPYLYGSEARDETPELDAMSQWFLHRFGAGNNVVTDMYTGLIEASYGLQNTGLPSAGFPDWDLYSDVPGQPIGPPFLLEEMQYSKYLYLIVDERMAADVPEVGVYFEGVEPTNFITSAGKSLFAGRLGKFNSVQWMYKVFASDNYAVYRMALPAENITYQTKAANFRGEISVG